eukprot:TRINITY_DN67778_c0_g1_i1.p1 TRINITY_DN67778_c0_g1~~TRINITY_DN67778_c0_g1_i1.p1  ORF type:complete len:225 (-),score=42.00 TRINITY_DN67778_c0_g1_i1:47-721(-)
MARVQDWTIERVLVWLDSVGLGEYRSTFKQNGVDGSTLFGLTKQDLKDELDIAKLPDRKRLWDELEELKARDAAAATTAARLRSSQDFRATSPPRVPADSNDPGVLEQLKRETQALHELMSEIEHVKIGEIDYSPVTSNPANYPHVPGQLPPQYRAAVSPTKRASVPSGDSTLDRVLSSYDARTRTLGGKVDYAAILREQTEAERKLAAMKEKHETIMKLTGFR